MTNLRSWAQIFSQISATADELLSTVREVRPNMVNAEGPKAEEIGEEMQMPTDRVREIFKIAQEVTSIDAKVGDDEDSRLGDFLEDTSQLSPVDQASRELLKESLEGVLGTLSDREAKVLRLRFGLSGSKPMTLEEVGREFGVTRERIRQIEAKALRKLKHPSRRKKLQDYMD